MRRGFTLLQLLFVLVAIAALTGIFVSVWNRGQSQQLQEVVVEGPQDIVEDGDNEGNLPTAIAEEGVGVQESNTKATEENTAEPDLDEEVIGESVGLPPMIVKLETKQKLTKQKQTEMMGQLEIEQQEVDRLLRLLNEFGSLSYTPQELADQQMRLKDRQARLIRATADLGKTRVRQELKMRLISELATVVQQMRLRNEPAFEETNANLTKVSEQFDDELKGIIESLDQILAIMRE